MRERLASLLLPSLGEGLQRPVGARSSQLGERFVLLGLHQGLLARTDAGFKALSFSPFARNAFDAGARNSKTFRDACLSLSPFDSVGDALSKIDRKGFHDSKIPCPQYQRKEL